MIRSVDSRFSWKKLRENYQLNGMTVSLVCPIDEWQSITNAISNGISLVSASIVILNTIKQY